jgi:TetR/AcrR family transcriptional regulator, mexJK operon transcriptional repressor
MADQVERRLLDAARNVFVNLGFEATTMDAVVVAARTSKRTLYSRFQGKEQLFAAVVADHIAHGFGPVHDALSRALGEKGQDGSLASLRRCLLKVGEAFLVQAVAPESQALDRAVFAAAHALPDLASRLHQDGYLRTVKIVGGLLTQHGATRPELAAQAFYSLLVLMPMRDDSPLSGEPSIEVAAVVDFVLAGAGLSAAVRRRSVPQPR